MKLAKILSEKNIKGVISISADATLRDVAMKLYEHNIDALLVTEPGSDNKFVGIISGRDIIRSCCHFEKPAVELKVADTMTKNMIVATADDNVEYVTGVMAKHKISHIPVFIGDKIVGLISMGDIIREMHNEDVIKIRRLSDFSGGTYGSKVY